MPRPRSRGVIVARGTTPRGAISRGGAGARLALAAAALIGCFAIGPIVRAAPPALSSDAPRAATDPTLHVHIVDYAAMSGEQRARAESEAARLWSAIDVRLTWSEGDPLVATPDALDVTLVVLRQDMAQRMIVAEHRGDGVLGRAVPEALRAYVFYDRVNTASDTLDAPRGAVLGRVFAHELAHLLLGHTHSHSGLFRAAPDLGSPREHFAPDDGTRIRTAIQALETSR
jgi:hypothetical protein